MHCAMPVFIFDSTNGFTIIKNIHLHSYIAA